MENANVVLGQKLSAPLSVVLSSCRTDLPELHLMMEGRPVDHCDDPVLGPVERVSHMMLQGQTSEGPPTG